MKIYIIGILITVTFSFGCQKENKVKEAPKRVEKNIDVTKGPFTKGIVATIKENQPYILVDILPEVNSFIKYAASSQKDYLRKRALLTCLEQLENKAEFKDAGIIKIRMIMVSESDEYGRGNWAMAPELALFEVKPTKLLTEANIPELKADELADFFLSQKYNTKYIKDSL